MAGGLLGNGLIGGLLGGGAMPTGGGLLGQYSPYNMEEMRRRMMAQGFGGASQALLNRNPYLPPRGVWGAVGDAVAGFTGGVQQGRKDYRQEKAEDLEYQRYQQQLQAQQEEQSRLRQQRQAQDRLAMGASPEQRNFAGAYPDEYGKVLASQMFPKPKDPIKLGGDQVLLDPNNYSQLAKGPPKSPLVAIDQKGQTAWAQESNKLFAKKYDDISTKAMAASDMLGLYGAAEQAIQTGVRTGSFGEHELSLRRLGAALGVGDADKLAGGELLTSIQNKMALMTRNPDSGMGMPGAVSDRDIAFLKAANIGIDRSPEGNRKMLIVGQKIEQRKIEIAQLADQYVQTHGQLDAGFNIAVREYAKANPLFDETLFNNAPASGGRVRVDMNGNIIE